MNDKEIFKKIGNIVNEIREQYEYLSANPANVNEFELELLRANTKFLSDHVEILQRLFQAGNGAEGLKLKAGSGKPEAESKGPEAESDEQTESQTTGAEPAADSRQPAAEDSIPQPESLKQKAESNDPTESQTTPSEPAADGRQPAAEDTTPEPAAAQNDTSAHEFVKEVVISERTIAIDEPVPVLAAPESPPTINDLMGQSRGAAPTVGSTIGQRAGDLKASISLNDKLLFIKDLFNGYSLAYSEVVDILNRSASFEAAKNFVEVNYAGKNNWAAKPATRDRFYAVLKQKFS